MNRIILIGNGFDLAHGLKTSYNDFINWFWERQFNLINDTGSKDWKTVDTPDNTYKLYLQIDFFDVKFTETDKIKITDFDPKTKDEKIAKEHSADIKTNQKPKFTSVNDLKSNIIYRNKFLEILEKRKKLLNWVDIEELYFSILKNCKERYRQSENVYEIYTVEQLNKEFSDIKTQLSEFLKTRNSKISDDNNYRGKLNRDIVAKLKNKISEGKPDKILLLNFNYTDTFFKFYKNIPANNLTHIQIHGRISDKKNPMIFGYGDEIAKDSADIEELNENAFLENVKSIKYVETENYSNLLKFIKEAEYEVFVFGHSCGNSDRTLLKALFENEHCDKIRCFYFGDNYNKTIDNIYRKFEDKTKFREKIAKKDKDNDQFPQFTGESPFKDEAEEVSPATGDSGEKDKSRTKEKPVEKEQPWIDKYNMVKVIFDNTSIAYKNMNDRITSKKDLKQDYYIGKYQLTQEEWQEIMGNNPAHFNGKRLPVVSVSWYDCIEFCNKLSDKHGLEKYYNINGTDVTFNTGANGFRLPTEAEWEYAAGGGRDSKGYEYAGCNTEGELKSYAWYEANSDDKMHPVGDKNPNELHLHDMSGNVWEWCEDSYRYTSLRVGRGGGWSSNAAYCRVSNRDYSSPDLYNYDVGFRLACSSKSVESGK